MRYGKTIHQYEEKTKRYSVRRRQNPPPNAITINHEPAAKRCTLMIRGMAFGDIVMPQSSILKFMKLI